MCLNVVGVKGVGEGASDVVVSGTVRGAAMNMLNGNENPIFFAQKF